MELSRSKKSAERGSTEEVLRIRQAAAAEAEDRFVRIASRSRESFADGSSSGKGT